MIGGKREVLFHQSTTLVSGEIVDSRFFPPGSSRGNTGGGLPAEWRFSLTTVSTVEAGSKLYLLLGHAKNKSYFCDEVLHLL